MNEQYNKKMLVVARKRLLATYLILFIVVVAVLGGTAYAYIAQNLKESIDLQVQVQQEKFNKFFDIQEVKIEELVRQAEKVIGQDPRYLKNILAEYTLNNDQVIAYYIGLEDGRSYFGDGWEPPSDYDVNATEWYQLTIQEESKVCYTSPYVDTLTGELVVTVAKQVRDASGSSIGVVATDVYLTDIIESLNETGISMPHYNILLDSEKNLLTHENTEYLPTNEKIVNYRDVQLEGYQYIDNQLVENGKVMTYQKDYDGQMKLFIVEQLGNGWYMGVVVARQIILKEVGALLSMIVGAILIMFLAIYVISITNIKRIVTPVKRLVADVEKITEGDLTVFNQIKEQDELGRLANCINYMVDTTGKVIKAAQILIDDVSIGMKHITNSSDSNNEAMTVITSLISGITDDNMIQLEQSEKTNKQMQNLVKDFIGLQTSAKRVSDNISETKKLADEGKEIIQSLQESSESVYDAMKDTSQKIDVFYKQIEEVKQVSDYITAIANQTQILSLNASIEAARSGENGKGFEVIAKEISALSILTKKSNEQINEVLKGLSVEIDVIVGATKNVVEYINQQYKVVEDTKEIFNTINDHLGDSAGDAENAFKTMNKAIGANQEVSEDMKKLDLILAQNNGRLQEITAMTEEQLSNSAEIGKQIEDISALCAEIQSQMKIFKIS